MPSHGGNELACQVSLEKALILYMKAKASPLNLLLMAQPSNSITLGS